MAFANRAIFEHVTNFMRNALKVSSSTSPVPNSDEGETYENDCAFDPRDIDFDVGNVHCLTSRRRIAHTAENNAVFILHPASLERRVKEQAI